MLVRGRLHSIIIRRHEARVRVRFAGPYKLIDLIEESEVVSALGASPERVQVLIYRPYPRKASIYLSCFTVHIGAVK